MHRRKYHIVGLLGISIIVRILQGFIHSISLGETEYSNSVFFPNIVEIVGLIFILYFGSSTRNYIKESKIFYLLRSKKESGNNIIGGTIRAIATIAISYVTIAYLINTILFSPSLEHYEYYIQGMIGTSMILFIMTIVTIGFSLITSSYIAAMISLVIYLLGYSINFIITSIEYNSNESVFSHSILSLAQFLLPRFDLLQTDIPFSNWSLALIGHGILGYLLYKITIYCFSYHHTHHENILNIGHQSQSRKT